ncbi:hypothetical protein Tdes44962_MAKER07445 [Teratosphaeria destructans]|uniref:Uncharacterized protein n=1 Tax=Teratosphaeria destructans TaxID=418781 RepID=A0A9W7SYR4_9PEZI|nr:hypothetical protein Tdes44962_MAKER07445 [Teratosphaeria destructans]
MHQTLAAAGLALLGSASATVTSFDIPCKIAPGSWFDVTLHNDGGFGYLEGVKMWLSPDIDLSSKAQPGASSMIGSFRSRHASNLQFSMISAGFTVANSTSTSLCSSQHSIEARSGPRLSDEGDASAQHETRDTPSSPTIGDLPSSMPPQNEQLHERGNGNTVSIANLVQSAESHLTAVGNAISRQSNFTAARAGMTGLAVAVDQLQALIANPGNAYCSSRLAPVRSVQQAMAYVDTTQRALNLITSGDAPTMIQNLCEAQASLQQLDDYVGGGETFGNQKTKRTWPFGPALWPPHVTRKAAAPRLNASNSTAVEMAVLQPLVQAAESHLAVLSTAILANDTDAAQTALDDFAYDQDDVWTLVDPQDAATCASMSDEKDSPNSTAALQVIDKMRAALNSITSTDEQSRLSALCTIAAGFDNIDYYVNGGPFAVQSRQERRSPSSPAIAKDQPSSSSDNDVDTFGLPPDVARPRRASRGSPVPQLLNCPGGPLWASSCPPPLERSTNSTGKDLRKRNASDSYLSDEDLASLDHAVDLAQYDLTHLSSSITFGDIQDLALPVDDAFDCPADNDKLANLTQAKVVQNIEDAQIGLRKVSLGAATGNKTTVMEGLCEVSMAFNADVEDYLFPDVPARRSTNSRFGDQQVQKLDSAIAAAQGAFTNLSSAVVSDDQALMESDFGALNKSLRLVKRYASDDYYCTGDFGRSLTDLHGDLTKADVLDLINQAQERMSLVSLLVADEKDIQSQIEFCQVYDILLGPVQAYVYPAPGSYAVNGRRSPSDNTLNAHRNADECHHKLARAAGPYLSDAERANLDNIIQSTESHLSNLSAALQTENEVAAQTHWKAFERGLAQIQELSIPGRFRGCDVQMDAVSDFSFPTALHMIEAAQGSLRQVSLDATAGDQKAVHQQLCVIEAHRKIIQQIDGRLQKIKRAQPQPELDRNITAALDALKAMADAVSDESAPDADGRFAAALGSYKTNIEASKRLVGGSDRDCSESGKREVAGFRDWLHDTKDDIEEGFDDVQDDLKGAWEDIWHDDDEAAKIKLCRADRAFKGVSGLSRRAAPSADDVVDVGSPISRVKRGALEAREDCM